MPRNTPPEPFSKKFVLSKPGGRGGPGLVVEMTIARDREDWVDCEWSTASGLPRQQPILSRRERKAFNRARTEMLIKHHLLLEE